MLALNPCIVTTTGNNKKNSSGRVDQSGGYKAHGTTTAGLTSAGDAGSGARSDDVLIVDITPSDNRVRWQAKCAATVGASQSGATSDPMTILRQRNANKLLAMASTSTSDSERYGTEVEKENWYPHAICLPNTFCDYTYDIRDALECLGGSMILLPLLRGLMMKDATSTEKASRIANVFGNLSKKDEEGHDNKNLAVVIIDMIFRLLRPGASSKRLVDVGLFALLAKILYQLPKAMKTMELFKVVSGHCQSFVVRNGGLLDRHHSFLCFKHLFADFHLWVTFPFSTISKLFAMLLSQAASDPEAMSRTVTVPTILNAMQKLYSEGCEYMEGIQRDEMLLVHSL